MILKVAIFVAFLALQWNEIYGDGTLTELVRMKKDIRQAFVDAHNEVRAAVVPRASDMAMMEWDKRVAKLAAKYARRCRFIHSDKDERSHRKFKYSLGENLFVGMTQYHQDPDIITEQWANEVIDYNFDTNRCNPGKMCGHYTQIVWSTTTKIGCAMAKCSNVESDFQLNPMLDLVAVCQYGPPGNWVGERPYKAGASCNQCPKDRTVCMNNLCVAG